MPPLPSLLLPWRKEEEVAEGGRINAEALLVAVAAGSSRRVALAGTPAGEVAMAPLSSMAVAISMGLLASMAMASRIIMLA